MHSPLEWPYPPFTAAEARESGISRQRLRRLLGQGQIRKVLHGVYQSQQAADTISSRAAAATLVMPPYAVICDRTAAWIHGVDVMRFRELEVPPPVDVVVLRYARRKVRSQWRNGERDLEPKDVMRIGTLRVTTPLRTALDLGCKLPRRDGLAAIDQFMRLHGLTTEEFKAELPRFVGRRGVVQLRALVEVADAKSESPAESWVRMTIVDAGLPSPEVQHSVVVDGFERYRLDLAYPRHRICIEYDGIEFHTTPEDRRADEERRTWLREQGWTVIVLTKDDLRQDAPTDWLDVLRAELLKVTPWPRG